MHETFFISNINFFLRKIRVMRGIEIKNSYMFFLKKITTKWGFFKSQIKKYLQKTNNEMIYFERNIKGLRIHQIKNYKKKSHALN
jgi:hypothetical protein